GFQVFDAQTNKIIRFLEHPYRYLHPSASPMSYGQERRSLVYDFYFGVRGGANHAWLDEAPTVPGDPEFLDQSHIIHAPATVGGVSADSYFFAPFDYSGNAMVALMHATGGTDGFASFNFHMGTPGQADNPGFDGEQLIYLSDQKAVAEIGNGDGITIYVPLSGITHEDCDTATNRTLHAKVAAGTDLGDNTACSGDDTVPVFQAALQNGWMAVAVVYIDYAHPKTSAIADVTAAANSAAASIVTWANSRAPDKILADARMEFDTWRKPPPTSVTLSDSERKLWRQSEAVLRMGQVREPNTPTRHNNGMMLASLPIGQWHTAWVRDGTYAIVALARSGHFDEARAALDFFMNAGPVRKHGSVDYGTYVANQDYRIALTRYFGTGEEECDWGSYNGGQNSPNIETDGWGLVLWAARQYVDAAGDAAWLCTATANGLVYDVLNQQIGKPIEANLLPFQDKLIMQPDSSIWEIHQPGRKYAYTNATAARGLCDLGAMAKKIGNDADSSHWSTISGKIVGALTSAFLDNQMAIGGSIEGLANNRYDDGSVAEVFTFDLLSDFTGPIATATLTMLNRLRQSVMSGGFKRNNDNVSSYDNNEWILIDFRIADALRRAGRASEADGYVNLIVSRAAVNFFLLPELYDSASAQGVYTGEVPMVGYGAGAYMMTVLDRANLIEPHDCGDAVTMPISCSMVDAGTVGDGGGVGGSGGSGGGDGDGGVGGDVPYRAACLCDFSGRSRLSNGMIIVVALPWLFLAFRLCRRRAK
ncbi:MAG: glycoside hydrolase family 15 protein, partial [Polyangia bacterium]